MSVCACLCDQQQSTQPFRKPAEDKNDFIDGLQGEGQHSHRKRGWAGTDCKPTSVQHSKGAEDRLRMTAVSKPGAAYSVNGDKKNKR